MTGGRFYMEDFNPHNYPMLDDTRNNLLDLLYRMNQVAKAWGKPMVVTSGLRDLEQQEALIAAGKSKAHKSKHLTGDAVDIEDKDGSLAEWVKANLPLMAKHGLWMEDFGHTKTVGDRSGWVHWQRVKPLSGNRVFIP